jgi:hypothetical protein
MTLGSTTLIDLKGPRILGQRFDAAVFHALTGAQEGLVVEYNWVLGPSLVSFTRLDTASKTTPDEAGSHAIIRRNVHLGLGITTKGYNHTVEHNTGSRFLAVESWKGNASWGPGGPEVIY